MAARGSEESPKQSMLLTRYINRSLAHMTIASEQNPKDAIAERAAKRRKLAEAGAAAEPKEEFATMIVAQDESPTQDDETSLEYIVTRPDLSWEEKPHVVVVGGEAVDSAVARWGLDAGGAACSKRPEGTL